MMVVCHQPYSELKHIDSQFALRMVKTFMRTINMISKSLITTPSKSEKHSVVPNFPAPPSWAKQTQIIFPILEP